MISVDIILNNLLEKIDTLDLDLVALALQDAYIKNDL